MPELEFHISFFTVTAMGGEHITTALDIPAPAATQWYQLTVTAMLIYLGSSDVIKFISVSTL